MEAQNKMLKKKKSQKQPLEKRSPLQNLNFHKSTTKNTSNLSSSSSAGARNGCLRVLRSSSSSSDISLPPTSSRKLRSFPIVVATDVSAKSVRSKENEMPEKKQQLGIHRMESGKSKTNPMFKTAERSKLSCGRREYVKISETKKLNSNFTPVGSSGVRRNAAADSGSRIDNGGSGGSVKTPPVEASLSPEIQSKMVVSKSAATPVCYGAGHLLSGVTDKRKCRRRGSLRGGCEKRNLFYDEKSDGNVADELQDCLVPLPGEASVRWLLSPCKEGCEERGSDSEMKMEDSEMSCGNASPLLDEFRVENLDSRCFLGNLDKKMCDSFLVATPNSFSNCNNVGLGEGKCMNENASAVSPGSLSSGNIIQTPDSDMSSYGYTSSVSFELGSIKETLDAVSLSPRREIPIKVEKNVESVWSWVSSCTSENLTLSQMRISWRDGLEGRIDENDEVDCCPCLSDNSDKHLKPYKLPLSVGGRVPTIEFPDNDASPILLEYEPCISAVPNEKTPCDGRNACAESICTNGGDLAVSCDSDWTNIEESCPFQVK